jgi:thymidylate synthase (FAD)
MKVTLIRWTKDPVNAIESAASNCYSSSTTDGKIMDHCYKSGHSSVLEFAEFHFHVEGVSRALTHQLVRSRLASFAQRSQRYIQEDDFKYVIPKSILNSKKTDEYGLTALDNFLSAMNYLKDTYANLIELGIPAEDSRSVLPNACETIIDVKMNLRELIHFMNERLCTCSQWEIRELANKMRSLVVTQEPKFDKFLVPKCEKDSPYCFCTEAKKRSCKKHPHISEAFQSLIV